MVQSLPHKGLQYRLHLDIEIEQLAGLDLCCYRGTAWLGDEHHWRWIV